MKLRKEQGKHSPRITQAMLEELRELRQFKSKASKRIEELTATIRVLHDAGVPPEMGALVYEFDEYERRSFSQGNLRRILSPTTFQRLWNRIEPTISRRLNIKYDNRLAEQPWELDL